jgi:hypothetical protein
MSRYSLGCYKYYSRIVFDVAWNGGNGEWEMGNGEWALGMVFDTLERGEVYPRPFPIPHFPFPPLLLRYFFPSSTIS